MQEAGRALVASLLASSYHIETPFRISIVPRVSADGSGSGGLGFTQFLPEERHLLSTDDVDARLTVLLAGRAAESVAFKATSSSLSDGELARAHIIFPSFGQRLIVVSF